MAKIKLTKTELKKQKDELQRYYNYLPTLNIKKKLLQKEILLLDQKLDEIEEVEERAIKKMESWVAVFGEDLDLSDLLTVKRVRFTQENLAGVDIPSFLGIDFEEVEYDLYDTPLWVDQGLVALKNRMEIKAELWVLKKRQQIINDELTVTSQRINLFEKIKIPEAKKNIQKITIQLEDQETIAIGWALEAKKKIAAKEAAMEAS